MFVSKLFKNIKLSGKWKTVYIKKHKLYKKGSKIAKKYNSSLAHLYVNSLAYSYLDKRYHKYLDSIVDPSLDKKIDTKPEKIIWWMWLQGEENAPEICKACLKSIRKELPDYKVVVLTSDNLFDYVHIPENIKTKYQQGYIPRAHFSDIARLSLLVEHGGVWADSTTLFTGNPKEYLELPLFMFKDFSFQENHPSAASNWLIASCKHHPILEATLKLLLKYWSDTSLLLDYYIFHYFLKMVTNRYPNLWKDVPNYPNKVPHILQFELFDDYSEKRFKQISSLSPIHKLNWHYQDTDKANENKKDFYHAICNQEIFK